MSGIISDNVGRATGLIKAAGGGGKILQVVSASDTTSRSHSSDSWSKASNTLDCAITPAATSSKIFVSFAVGMYSSGDFQASIYRDSTNLGDSDDGVSRLNSKVCFGGGLVDSPSTTSEVTYSVQIKAEDAPTSASLNYSNSTSYMLVMEIGA